MTAFWIEVIGWIAAAFTLAAYSMKTMMPLRVAAIAANVFFIAYGYLLPVWPTFVLHLVLLPFNSYRLFELIQLDRRAKDAMAENAPLRWIGGLVSPVYYPPGEPIFRKGDPPDHVYYLDEGEVTLVESGITLKAGEIFGEIAFFTQDNERTMTAVAGEGCKIMMLDERDFMRLYYQKPEFALYVVRLIASRLSENRAQTDYEDETLRDTMAQ